MLNRAIQYVNSTSKLVLRVPSVKRLDVEHLRFLDGLVEEVLNVISRRADTGAVGDEAGAANDTSFSEHRRQLSPRGPDEGLPLLNLFLPWRLPDNHYLRVEGAAADG